MSTIEDYRTAALGGDASAHLLPLERVAHVDGPDVPGLTRSDKESDDPGCIRLLRFERVYLI